LITGPGRVAISGIVRDGRFEPPQDLNYYEKHLFHLSSKGIDNTKREKKTILTFEFLNLNIINH
jgi:hypothetical protein